MNRDPAIVALREALEQRLERMADEATERIVLEVPAYRAADEQFRADIRAHVVAHLRASLESLGADREVTREDLLFVRPHAARRTRRVSVTEFVQAFYVGERVLWDTALALAHDDESRRAALAFASHLPRYFEVATTHAAEVYLETQEQLAATGERIRRDLLEDLLAGRELDPGPRLDAARAAGVRDDASFVVITATPCDTPGDEQLLRGGASALARAVGGRTLPLAVVRHDEIVVVVPAVDGLPGGDRGPARGRPATARGRRAAARRRREHDRVRGGADSGRLPGVEHDPDRARLDARRLRAVGADRVRVPDAPRRPDREPSDRAGGPRVRRPGLR